MPADQLTGIATCGISVPALEVIERAVLRAIGGTMVGDAAAAEGIEPSELASAVEVYQQAGRQALAAQAQAGWRQLYIEFADWDAAEQVAVHHLAPLLDQARADGTISAWWFIRKHPCWRLRLRPVPGGPAATVATRLPAALDHLAAAGQVSRWWPGIYEPESAAFGGDDAMTVAHELFIADSRAIMGLLGGAGTGLGRRELSLLLCHVLMRAAGLEFYEQGDVWHQVARERPLPADVPADRLTGMAGSLKTLMLADTEPGGELLGPHGPAAAAAGWAAAFRQAGHALGELSRAGQLRRGLRQVLSYHIIFHWNRLGLPYRTQSILAWAARTAILGPPDVEPSPDAASRDPARPAPPRSASPVDLDRVTGRFPLVRHPRPRCAALAERVRQVSALAATCHEPADHESRIDQACTAWNLASLIASDCAVPGLATELCERQFRLFQAHWPVAGRTAIAALQPLVNLARLDIRAGNPEDAYQALDQIYHAVQHGGTAQIRGTALAFSEFTADAPARSEVLPWLRNVLLQDGTRALVSAGRWEHAAGNAARYDTRPGYLRESRQARVITLTRAGQPAAALALLSTAAITQPWEHAIASCLRACARLATGHPAPDDLTQMLATTRLARQRADRQATMFQLRLSLTAADLAAELDPNAAGILLAEIIDSAGQSADAYAAREALGHPACRAHMSPAQATALTTLTGQAGLGHGTIPPPLLTNLTQAVSTAETTLAQALSGSR